MAAGLVQRAFDEGHPVRALGLVYPCGSPHDG
ncbi:hypothetical protein [Corynebacterium tuberculostearicum]